MKRTIALLLALLMLLCLCGCSAEPEEENEFTPERGTAENGIYKNESFGFTFSADSDWYYYNDEEIAETVGAPSENGEIIYDMYCINSSDGIIVSVNLENLGVMYGTVLDEESYLENAASQVEDKIISGGDEVTKNEAGTIEIDGKEVPCIYVTMESYGMPIYEVIAVKKIGNWMGVFTVGCLDEADLAETVKKISFE